MTDIPNLGKRPTDGKSDYKMPVLFRLFFRVLLSRNLTYTWIIVRSYCAEKKTFDRNVKGVS